MGMACFFENASRSGMRAMVPSSFMISQMTPAGVTPARRARSTEPSVCPVRTRTPPRRARNGNTWPGVTMSSGRALAWAATRIVCARSAALMPVVTPWRASMLTVKAVPSEGPLRPGGCIIGSLIRSTCSSTSVTQMRPRPCVAMKLMASGVTNWAAMVRSPSFSRSSSSTRMTILPARMSAMAPAMRSVSLGSMVRGMGLGGCASGRSCGQPGSHVPREQVHLEVDPVAGGEIAQAGDLQRDGDEHDVEGGVLSVSHGVDGEAHAAHRDRALLGHEALQARGQREGRRRGLSDRVSLEEGSHLVDVPRDDVTPQTVARAQGPLQVHARPDGPVAQRGAGQRLARGVDGEAVGADLDDRQASAVDGDGLAHGEGLAFQAGPEEQSRAGTARRPLRQHSRRLHEPGEHGVGVVTGGAGVQYGRGGGGGGTLEGPCLCRRTCPGSRW